MSRQTMSQAAHTTHTSSTSNTALLMDNADLVCSPKCGDKSVVSTVAPLSRSQTKTTCVLDHSHVHTLADARSAKHASGEHARF